MTRYCSGNNVTPNSPLPAVKGKEKVENVAAEAEDDEDSDEEMDEEDEDEDVSPVPVPEMPSSG